MVFCFKAILSIRYQGVYNFKAYWYLTRKKYGYVGISPPPRSGLIIPLAIEIPSLNPTVGKAFHTGIEKITGKLGN